MIKCIEQSDINSCWNKAKSHERIFVLLARDEAAPEAIRFWCEKRIELGLNPSGDAQIQEARECARLMEKEQAREKEKAAHATNR